MAIRLSTWLTATLSLLWTIQALANDAGFTTVQVPAPQGPPLDVGIWYPTAAHPSEQRLELLTQSVAPGAEPLPGPHPLIVISHGSSGSYSSHYDTALALAQAGFVVAAPSHTADTYKDNSRAVYLTDRPNHTHAVIDYMLTTWPGHATLDPAAIGAFGFSSGGFTMLVALGGVPDMARTVPFCDRHPQDFGCKLRKAHPEATLDAFPPDAWLADPRIHAAVIAAPAVGYAFTRAGLSPIQVPIQLWRAEQDRIEPSPDFAEAVRDALPHPPEYHVVPGADHFDFLAPCSPALASVAPAICHSHPGFDRTLFHQQFNAAVIRFFNQTLPKTSPPIQTQ